MRRHLNKRLLVVLAVAGVLLGVGIHVLHGVQVRRSARVLLKLSAQAEADGDLARAAQHLERYLTYRPQDGEALVKFALILEAQAQTRTGRERALRALQKAALARPDRQDVRRKAVRVAL